MTTIQLPPKVAWQHQGSPEITEWCPRCDCRVITKGDLCAWCDKNLTGRRVQPPRKSPKVRIQPLGDRASRAYYWLLKFGPAPAKTIAAATGVTHRRTTDALRDLRSRKVPLVERCGTVPPTYREDFPGLALGRPEVLYRAIRRPEFDTVDTCA